MTSRDGDRWARDMWWHCLLFRMTKKPHGSDNFYQPILAANCSTYSVPKNTNWLVVHVKLWKRKMVLSFKIIFFVLFGRMVTYTEWFLCVCLLALFWYGAIGYLSIQLRVFFFIWHVAYTLAWRHISCVITYIFKLYCPIEMTAVSHSSWFKALLPCYRKQMEFHHTGTQYK